MQQSLLTLSWLADPTFPTMQLSFLRPSPRLKSRFFAHLYHLVWSDCHSCCHTLPHLLIPNAALRHTTSPSRPFTFPHLPHTHTHSGSPTVALTTHTSLLYYMTQNMWKSMECRILNCRKYIFTGRLTRAGSEINEEREEIMLCSIYRGQREMTQLDPVISESCSLLNANLKLHCAFLYHGESFLNELEWRRFPVWRETVQSWTCDSVRAAGLCCVSIFLAASMWDWSEFAEIVIFFFSVFCIFPQSFTPLKQYSIITCWQSECSSVHVALSHVFPPCRDCDEFQIHPSDVFSKSTHIHYPPHASEERNTLIYAAASALQSALVFCLMNWLILYEQYEKQI